MTTRTLLTARRLAGAALAVGLATLAGCGGGPKLASVSGVVTVDGKPYTEAVVSFQPIGDKGNPSPGRGSSGYTDANGRFVLKYDGTEDGAVVGTHLVRIQTKGNNVAPLVEGTGSDDYTPPAGVKIDPIPPEWNGLSEKTFVVPAGGTDQANFDIVSRKAGKKK
jgi:hypothetical protein